MHAQNAFDLAERLRSAPLACDCAARVLGWRCGLTRQEAQRLGLNGAVGGPWRFVVRRVLCTFDGDTARGRGPARSAACARGHAGTRR